MSVEIEISELGDGTHEIRVEDSGGHEQTMYVSERTLRRLAYQLSAKYPDEVEREN